MLGGKGGGRLSMQDIMARLTAKAYMEYDQAARGHATARLLQEALAVPPKHRPSMMTFNFDFFVFVQLALSVGA